MPLKGNLLKLAQKSDGHTRRFVCLTNIPTPYRLHLFRNFFTELAKRGWAFEVWFMAESEPGRRWKFQPSDFDFPCRFFGGRSLNVGGTSFHFNAGVIEPLRTEPPDILLIGGAWVHPSSIVAALSTRFLNRSTLLFWSESHLDSRAYTNPVTNKLRSALFLVFDGFAVPGSLALNYTKLYAPNKPTYILPNTVNESVFRDGTLKYRRMKLKIRSDLGIQEQKRLLLLPARLLPNKGIIPFLSAASCSSVTEKLTVIVAGDGPLRERLALWVKENPSADVRVLGQVSQKEMAKLYGIADTFVLPSLGDPNPLAVIEALWAELPLLLSDRVGNHPEALVPGENGWLFNPESPDGIREVVERWAAISDDELQRQSRVSATIARERFQTEAVVNNFLDRILEANKAATP